MLKYLCTLVGLVCLNGLSLAAQSSCPAAAQCAACAQGPAQACAQCGCRMVPVCRCYCDVKKETKWKFSCTADLICVPGPGCLFGNKQSCAGAGSARAEGCPEGCPAGTCNHKNSGSGCSIHCVRQLVKWPAVKESPVRKCTVEWVCPHGCCQGQAPCENAVPAATPPTAPAPPAPFPPVPAPRTAERAASGSAIAVDR